MEIGFQIENISVKEADDICIQVMEYIRDELDLIISEYWIGLELE